MKMKLKTAHLLATALGTATLISNHAAQAEIDGGSPAICGHGCWVWIYSDDEFEGPNDILCGPFKRSNMIKLPNAHVTDWSEEINSMKIGPNATLRIWEDVDFEGYSKFYNPGTVKTDFDEDSDVEQANSMEMICMR